MSRPSLSAALVVLALGRSVVAQTVDVEAEHQRGVTLRNEHRDAEALAVFRGLYDRSGEVRALARVALAEAALSRWVDAEAHLQRALAADDAWVAQNRASLEQGLAAVRQHLGTLAVHVDVAGAEVLVAGVPVGTTPLNHPLRVAAGSVDVEVRAPQRAAARRAVMVRAGTEVTGLDIELPAVEATPHFANATAATPTSDPTPTLEPDAVNGSAPPVMEPNARREREARRATLETLSTTSLVIGGAGLLTAAIGVGLRESAVSTFNSNGCLLLGEDPGVFANGYDCAARYSQGETATAVAIAGLAVGVAFAVTGVVLRVVAPSAPTRRAVACGPSMTGVGMLCGGRF